MSNRILCFLYCLICLQLSGYMVYGQFDIAHLAHRLKTAQSDTQKIKILDSIVVYYSDKYPDTAMSYARLGLELAQIRKYTYSEAEFRLRLSQIYSHTGNPEDAASECRQALRLYKTILSEKGIAEAYNQLGVIEAKKANYTNATYYILEAKKIFDKLHDSTALVNIYMNLGVMLEESMNLHDHGLDKALDYFMQALTYCKNNPKQKLNLLNNIGIVYGKKGQFKKSLTYFNTVLEQTDTAGAFVSVRLNALTNCVVAYDNLGDHVRAYKYAQEQLFFARKYHVIDEEVLGLINVGVMQTNTDMHKGLGTINEGFELAKKLGDKRLQLQAYSNIVGVYVDHKDYKNAFDVLNKQNELSAEVFNMEKARQMSRLLANYELDKSNNKVEELKVINHQNEIQKIFMLLFTLLISGAFLVIVFYYRQVIILNKQLTLQQEELKELNKVKDKLFSVIGHDLRSPVGSIVSLLSIWDTDSITAEEKTEVIGHLKSQSRATLDTLDKLLNWGQAQIKGISIFQTLFAPKRVIKDSLELLAEQALQKNITIIDNTPTDMKIFADCLQFDFVIRNLLSNAIKFTHINGAIEISADTSTIDGCTAFKIKDNGVGITPERQLHIFDARGTSTVGTAQEKGTNLGLKLCKEYVVSNGGKIWVNSQPGKGTSFNFSVKNIG
jgi:signal transduction histidine kinase